MAKQINSTHTKKQRKEMYRKFCEHYVAHSNVRDAVIFARAEAGADPCTNDVAAKSMGYRWLRNAKVQKEMDAARERYLKILGVNPRRVLAELAKIAFAQLPDIFVISDQGEAVFDLNLMTPEMKAAFADYQVETYVEGRGDQARDVKKVRVKLHNKLDALDKLMKHMGMFEKDNEQQSAGLIEGIRAGRERSRLAQKK